MRPTYLLTPLISLLLCACQTFQSAEVQQDQQRMDAVKAFAKTVLTEGKDRYHPNQPAPLWADAINVKTREPMEWVFPDGHKAVLSNLSCQQNLLRVLAGLSNLTGDPQYKDAAKATLAYYFQHYQDPNGLMYWGGHRFIDLKTLQPEGPSEKEMVHELKNAFPYYDLMFEVDKDATTKFIRAFWNAHVYEWKTLETGRHGEYEKKIGALWNNDFQQMPPYFETKGLSFLQAGNDLIYSAFTLYKYTGDEGALRWGKRLAQQYVLARDPKTGLGAYQYTQPRKTQEPDSDSNTLSMFGDRARRQFGPEFPQALEARMLFEGQASSIYSENALMQLQLGKDLGPAGQDLFDWTRSGLLAYQKYAYLPDSNQLRPMLTDGTDLSNFSVKRDGYYGKKGRTFAPYPAGNKFLTPYARAFLLTGNPQLWTMARGIARANGLGDLGTAPGENVAVNLNTASDDPLALFALLDIYRQSPHASYLALARTIGNNIVKNRFHDGVFTETSDLKYANFDTIEPYALLALQATIDGKPDAVAPFINGNGFTEGGYLRVDGKVQVSAQDRMLFKLKENQELGQTLNMPSAQ